MTNNTSDRNLIILLLLILFTPVVLVLLFYRDGQLPIVPTATASVTLMPIPPTAFLTATEPTLPTLTPTNADATPTQEWACIPDSYSAIEQRTPLYKDADLTEQMTTQYQSQQTIHFNGVFIEAGEIVLLTADKQSRSWWVVAESGDFREGYVARKALPDACQ